MDILITAEIEEGSSEFLAKTVRHECIIFCMPIYNF
jgi:hypothetical protein